MSLIFSKQYLKRLINQDAYLNRERYQRRRLKRFSRGRSISTITSQDKASVLARPASLKLRLRCMPNSPNHHTAMTVWKS